MKNDEKQNKLRLVLTAAVLLHLGVVVWHGSSHSHVPVPITFLQTVFVVIVIVLLPLIGGGLMWTSLRQFAVWLVTLSMFGALAFGVINHFILTSPDNIMEVPAREWRNSFVVSAYLLVVIEALGTILGLVAIRSRKRTA